MTLHVHFQVVDAVPDEEEVQRRLRHRGHPLPEANLRGDRSAAHLLLLRHHRHGVLPRIRPRQLLQVRFAIILQYVRFCKADILYSTLQKYINRAVLQFRRRRRGRQWILLPEQLSELGFVGRHSV